MDDITDLLKNSRVVFSDVNLEAGTSPEEYLRNADSITQSVFIILGTRKRSRKWRPRFGSFIEQFLFDPFDEATASNIREEIFDALEDPYNGENRIRVKRNEIEVLLDFDTMSYYVEFPVSVPSLGIKDQPIKFNLRRES